MTDDDTYNSDGPECPYCGHVHNPDEEPSHYYNQASETSSCSSCGTDFQMEVSISYSWTTKKDDSQ